MPTSAEVLTNLQPLFRDILDVPDLVLTEQLSAKDVPEWDSLNHVRLIVATEKKFAVRLGSAEIEKLKCVGDLSNLVASKLSA